MATTTPASNKRPRSLSTSSASRSPTASTHVSSTDTTQPASSLTPAKLFAGTGKRQVKKPKTADENDDEDAPSSRSPTKRQAAANRSPAYRVISKGGRGRAGSSAAIHDSVFQPIPDPPWVTDSSIAQESKPQPTNEHRATITSNSPGATRIYRPIYASRFEREQYRPPPSSPTSSSISVSRSSSGERRGPSNSAIIMGDYPQTSSYRDRGVENAAARGRENVSRTADMEVDDDRERKRDGENEHHPTQPSQLPPPPKRRAPSPIGGSNRALSPPPIVHSPSASPPPSLPPPPSASSHPTLRRGYSGHSDSYDRDSGRVNDTETHRRAERHDLPPPPPSHSYWYSSSNPYLPLSSSSSSSTVYQQHYPPPPSRYAPFPPPPHFTSSSSSSGGSRPGLESGPAGTWPSSSSRHPSGAASGNGRNTHAAQIQPPPPQAASSQIQYQHPQDHRYDHQRQPQQQQHQHHQHQHHHHQQHQRQDGYRGITPPPPVTHPQHSSLSVSESQHTAMTTTTAATSATAESSRSGSGSGGVGESEARKVRTKQEEEDKDARARSKGKGKAREENQNQTQSQVQNQLHSSPSLSLAQSQNVLQVAPQPAAPQHSPPQHPDRRQPPSSSHQQHASSSSQQIPPPPPPGPPVQFHPPLQPHRYPPPPPPPQYVPYGHGHGYTYAQGPPPPPAQSYSQQGPPPPPPPPHVHQNPAPPPYTKPHYQRPIQHPLPRGQSVTDLQQQQMLQSTFRVTSTETSGATDNGEGSSGSRDNDSNDTKTKSKQKSVYGSKGSTSMSVHTKAEGGGGDGLATLTDSANGVSVVGLGGKVHYGVQQQWGDVGGGRGASGPPPPPPLPGPPPSGSSSTLPPSSGPPESSGPPPPSMNGAAISNRYSNGFPPPHGYPPPPHGYPSYPIPYPAAQQGRTSNDIEMQRRHAYPVQQGHWLGNGQGVAEMGVLEHQVPMPRKPRTKYPTGPTGSADVSASGSRSGSSGGAGAGAGAGGNGGGGGSEANGQGYNGMDQLQHHPLSHSHPQHATQTALAAQDQQHDQQLTQLQQAPMHVPLAPQEHLILNMNMSTTNVGGAQFVLKPPRMPRSRKRVNVDGNGSVIPRVRAPKRTPEEKELAKQAERDRLQKIKHKRQAQHDELMTARRIREKKREFDAKQEREEEYARLVRAYNEAGGAAARRLSGKRRQKFLSEEFVAESSSERESKQEDDSEGRLLTMDSNPGGDVEMAGEEEGGRMPAVEDKEEGASQKGKGKEREREVITVSSSSEAEITTTVPTENAPDLGEGPSSHPDHRPESPPRSRSEQDFHERRRARGRSKGSSDPDPDVGRCLVRGVRGGKGWRVPGESIMDVEVDATKLKKAEDMDDEDANADGGRLVKVKPDSHPVKKRGPRGGSAVAAAKAMVAEAAAQGGYAHYERFRPKEQGYDDQPHLPPHPSPNPPQPAPKTDYYANVLFNATSSSSGSSNGSYYQPPGEHPVSPGNHYPYAQMDPDPSPNAPGPPRGSQSYYHIRPAPPYPDGSHQGSQQVPQEREQHPHFHSPNLSNFPPCPSNPLTTMSSRRDGAPAPVYAPAESQALALALAKAHLQGHTIPPSIARSLAEPFRQRHGGQHSPIQGFKRTLAQLLSLTESQPRPLGGQDEGGERNTFPAPGRPSRKVKRYPCDVCGQIFTRSGDVRRHKKSRHSSGGKECLCPFCGRVLTRQDALQRHWDKYCRQKSEQRHLLPGGTGTSPSGSPSGDRCWDHDRADSRSPESRSRSGSLSGSDSRSGDDDRDNDDEEDVDEGFMEFGLEKGQDKEVIPDPERQSIQVIRPAHTLAPGGASNVDDKENALGAKQAIGELAEEMVTSHHNRTHSPDTMPSTARRPSHEHRRSRSHTLAAADDGSDVQRPVAVRVDRDGALDVEGDAPSNVKKLHCSSSMLVRDGGSTGTVSHPPRTRRQDEDDLHPQRHDLQQLPTSQGHQQHHQQQRQQHLDPTNHHQPPKPRQPGAGQGFRNDIELDKRPRSGGQMGVLIPSGSFNGGGAGQLQIYYHPQSQLQALPNIQQRSQSLQHSQLEPPSHPSHSRTHQRRPEDSPRYQTQTHSSSDSNSHRLRQERVQSPVERHTSHANFQRQRQHDRRSEERAGRDDRDRRSTYAFNLDQNTNVQQQRHSEEQSSHHQQHRHQSPQSYQYHVHPPYTPGQLPSREQPEESQAYTTHPQR